jgi:outer membrane protein assembly factor BamB
MANNKVGARQIVLLLLINLYQCSGPTESYISSFFETGDRIQSHAIIDDEVIYFGSNDKTFYAVDLNTGVQKWSYPAGSAVKSSAAIKDSILYFSSGNSFYALNKSSGREIWTYVIESLVPRDNLDPWDYHHGAPVIHHNEVYLGCENGLLYCFNAMKGDLEYAWSTIDSAAIRCTPAIKDYILYTGDWNGMIYAFDLKTRDTLWTYRTYQEQFYPTFGRINTRLYIHDSLLIFGARNHEIQVININTGTVVWSHVEQNGGWISGDPLVAGDTLYIGGSDCHKLFAFHIATGELFWTYEFLLNSFSSPIIEGDHIFFTTGDAYAYMGSNYGSGYLYALDRKDGSIVNFSLIGGNVFTDPLVYEDNIYMGSDDMHIYAIDLPGFLSDSATLQLRGYEFIDQIAISPNPFQDSTTISFQVNYETSVKAIIYDLDRKEISILQDGPLTIGNHPFVWDGKDSLGTEAPAGYYIFEAGSGEYFKNAFIQKN